MRIGVIGDVHLVWNDRDVALLDAQNYDLILFVGDLAGYGPKGAIRVARSIAKLRTPALVVPGNHDCATVPQFAAEVFRAPDAVRDALAFGMRLRVGRLRRALGAARLGGYDLHRFDPFGVTVLCARPHSIGGERIAFRRYLTKRFGVRTMEESAAKLCALFDAIPADQRVFVLAHCGPRGLGGTRSDIYGNDFRPEEGDWGDPDLERALEHARETRKSVIAVIAGHMHHRLRGGGQRRWHVQRDGIEHINAARVPRARRDVSGKQRHHVRLSLDGSRLSVDPVWLTEPCHSHDGK